MGKHRKAGLPTTRPTPQPKHRREMGPNLSTRLALQAAS